MEDLVEEYSNELAPFAVQLCQQLVTKKLSYLCLFIIFNKCNNDIYLFNYQCTTFLHIMQEYQESEAAEINDNCDIEDFIDGYDMSDRIITASGVLKTIITLILSLESSTDLLHQLEIVLSPIISFTLENNIMGNKKYKFCDFVFIDIMY